LVPISTKFQFFPVTGFFKVSSKLWPEVFCIVLESLFLILLAPVYGDQPVHSKAEMVRLARVLLGVLQAVHRLVRLVVSLVDNKIKVNKRNRRVKDPHAS
jgi:hypothetical protein